MTEGMFLKFDLLKEGDKTNQYLVVSKKTSTPLGFVKWYGAFRKYCFFPADQTIFDPSCLRDIINFINFLMDERKKK